MLGIGVTSLWLEGKNEYMLFDKVESHPKFAQEVDKIKGKLGATKLVTFSPEQANPKHAVSPFLFSCSPQHPCWNSPVSQFEDQQRYFRTSNTASLGS